MNVVSVDSGTVHFTDETVAHPFPMYSTPTMALMKFRFTDAPVTCQTCILKANEGTDTMPPAAKKTAAKKSAAKKTTAAPVDVDAVTSEVHGVVDEIKAIDPGSDDAETQAGDLRAKADALIRQLPRSKHTALRKTVADAVKVATTKPEPAASTEVALSDDPMTWDGVPALIAHGVKEMRKGVDAGLQLTSAGEQVANVLLTIRQTMIDPETGLPDLVWRMKATRNAAAKVYGDVLKDIPEDDEDRRASHASLIKATNNKASDVLVAWLRGYKGDSEEDMALLREIFPEAADAVEADAELTPEQAIRNLYAEHDIELPLRGRTEHMRLTRRVEKIQKLTKELEANEDAGNAERVEELKGAISDLKTEIPADMLPSLDAPEKTDVERTTEAVAKIRKDLEAAGKRFAKVKGAQKRKVKTELYDLIREAAKTFDLDLSALVESGE